MDEQPKNPKGSAGKGRPKGSINKRSQEMLELLEQKPNWQHPIDFLADVYLDPTKDITLRVKAATDVLPYIAPKLKQIEVTGADGGPVSNTYTWLPPEPVGTVPMATVGMSMDEAEGEEPKE